uniref:tRNA(Ile)-lysidine synthase n=1 Tax=Hildenbrandia rubra TaxID=31481 RepID=A0A1C9CG08_9FLOR|nr:tRNA(Ile)-lysidine synthase [Hildenbrandia rubra]AOM67302.1 tRNA(Ile)-lysidine synthase [Hildenbrandia rubra]
MYITHIHKKFITYICSKYYIVNNSSILLSISGGQDSLSLLKLTLDLKKHYHWKVCLTYFDHKLREDSYFNLKQLLNILRITRLKSCIYENFSRTDAELQYREWRYKILFHIAHTNHYSKIFTAHTLTDLSETFIHHIIRGCSIDSLANISSTTKHNTLMDISILRPLLCIKRIETGWLCKKFYLPLWSDYTNYECKRTRNRLREELIPYLQQYFQPKIYCKIDTFLQNTQLDMEYLRKATIKLYYLVKHPYFVAINYSILLSHPEALQYRVIRLFFKHNFNTVLTKSTICKITVYLAKKKQMISFINSLKFQLFFTNSWLYALIL